MNLLVGNMKIKINKIITLSVLFLANYVFAMEQENLTKKNLDELRIDFTKILPQEIIQEIIKICLGNIKYPKIEIAKKSQDLNNLKLVCKSLCLLVNDLLERKKPEFEKYDQLNKPLYDLLVEGPGFFNFDAALDLINQGADINFQDKDNWSVLYFAIRNGELRIIKWFIENGANLNLSLPSETCTMLEYAEFRCNFKKYASSS